MIDAQSNDCEDQEDNEIAKSCGYKPVPLSFDWDIYTTAAFGKVDLHAMSIKKQLS